MRERVRDARVGRLGTVGPDGRPHLVPVCFALEGDVLLGRRREAEALETPAAAREHPQSPGVAVLVDHYDEDWTQLWWVRLDGAARVLDTGSEREHALALLIEKYEQYRVQARPARSSPFASSAGAVGPVGMRPDGETR